MRKIYVIFLQANIKIFLLVLSVVLEEELQDPLGECISFSEFGISKLRSCVSSCENGRRFDVAISPFRSDGGV